MYYFLFKYKLLFSHFFSIFDRFKINIQTIIESHPFSSKMNQINVSTRANKIFTFFICLVVFAATEYGRIQATQVEEKVISAQNCKSYATVVYATQNNQLFQWRPFFQPIRLALPFTSKLRYLACSKYGSTLESSYIGVLDEQGQIFLTEEAHSGFYPANLSTRSGGAQQISIGDNLISIYYKNLSLIEIYDIKGQNFIGMIQTNHNITNMQMDIFRNLAIIQISELGIPNLKYYKIRDYTIQIIGESLLPVQFQPPLTLDYYKIDEKTINFLIAQKNAYGQIKFDIKNEKFIGQLAINRKSLSYPKLCDGKVTFMENNNYISKQKRAEIINQNEILMYACTTDTGMYINSQFYLFFSIDGEKAGLSAFNQVNDFILYSIIIGVVFFFFCCSLWVRIASRRNGARDYVRCFSVLNELFCWCPTLNNIIKLEQVIEE